MDDLPLELVVHILSFLPGEEIIKFKQLSSSICRIISSYRDSLKYPEVRLSIYDDYYDPPTIKLKLQYVYSFWEFDYVYPRFIALESCEGGFYFSFLGPFFANRKRLEQRTFRTFLDFILKKVDFDELCINMKQPDCISVITEALKEHRPRILKVGSGVSEKLCHLLRTIADNADNRRNSRPTLRVDFRFAEVASPAANMRNIMEIVPLFRNTLFEINDTGITIFIEEFAEEWRNDPTDVFGFEIQAQIFLNDGQLEPFVIPRLEGQFRITTILAEYLNNYHPDGLASAIILEDRRTGSILRFDKTDDTLQERLPGQEDGLVKIQISAILK